MVTKAERDRKNASATFRDLMDSNLTHVRVGQERADNTRVTLLTTATHAHSLDGCCTCCPRRPAGEPSAREQAATAARAAAHRAAELGPPARPAVVPSHAVPLALVDEPTVKADAIARARAAAVDSAARLGRTD